MEKITFTPNVPVEVALKYPAGKIVTGIFGDQVYFTTADNRAMYLDLQVAEQINHLRPKPGEPIVILKHWSGKKTERPEWTVWLSNDAEKGRAIEEARQGGSDLKLVSQIQDSIKLAREGKLGELGDGRFSVARNGTGARSEPARSTPPPVSPSNDTTQSRNGNNGEARLMPWALFLLNQTNALVDVYGLALKHASEKHGNTVKPEDVRALLTTAWISQTETGTPNVG